MKALSFDTLPTGAGNGCAFSPDGTYLAVVYDESPYLSIYKWDGSTYTKLGNPTFLPAGIGNGCAFSPDGTYLVVAHDESPFVTVYKRTEDVFTKLADPAVLPTGAGNGCVFSADGIYLAVAHNSTPYITIYKRNGDVFTKLTNPASLPTINGRCCAFSADGVYLVIGNTSLTQQPPSSYINIYKRSGDTFTKLTNPSALPSNAVRGCSFSPDGVYLALASHNEQSLIYKRTGDVFTALVDPALILPDDTYGCAFSPDGVYLAFVYEDSPFAIIYEHDGDTFTQTSFFMNLGPDDDYGRGCAFSADGTYFAVARYDSPYIQAYNWLLDEIPNPPTLLAPKDAYIGIDSDQSFEWLHNIATDTDQTYADLQYSSLGGAWQGLISVSGAGMSTLIPAHTFASGRYQWRARTYNLDGIPGDWSDPASFVGVGQPARPSIDSVSNVSRPTVSWQSTDQIAYQLRIRQDAVIYDTGETAGTGKSHMVKLFLSNGDYVAELRIKNASLFWSEWTTYGFSIDVVPPAAPTIKAEPIINGAHLVITGSGSNKAYLLRDGIPVADITGLTEYDDYAVLGAVQYIVRIVDSAGNYADSLPAVALISVSCAILAAVDDLENVVIMNQKAAGQSAVTGQKQLTGTAHYYAGRELPVYTYDGTASEQYSPTFYYTDPAEWKRLVALIDRRRTLLYRDRLGNRFYGVVTSVSHTRENDMINFALSLLRVDYAEAIEYEV